MKLKFTDAKQYNLILKDAEANKSPIIKTEEEYEELLNKSYKGKELATIYDDIHWSLSDLFDEVYRDLGYPGRTKWFIDPEILRDDAKMKVLYEAVRDSILDKFNSGDIYRDPYDNLGPEAYDKLKNIFKIKYTFEDREYLLDEPEFKPDTTSELEEEYNNLLEEQKDEENKDEGKLVNSTCKEFLEAYENKVDKKDPKWYLIQIALNKDKGWAYIKKPEDLQGNVELDVVTPKTAKKIIKQGTQK